MSDPTPTLTLAVCTRGRPDQLRAALDALARGAPGVALIVVEQSDAPDPALAERAAAEPGMRVIRDRGSGLSRARNLALHAAETDWLAFVDDDCTVAADFGEALAAELRAHPEADWIAGDVRAEAASADPRLPEVTTFPVDRALVRRGGRTLPGAIGFGVMFCVRRATAERLGGWDERFGPGVADLPAADDMDFNHRLLRAGGVAVLSPRVRATHRQWRSPAEVVGLQRGYSRAWAALACKHRGAGGGRLWAWGAVDVLDMAASAGCERSALRARIALAKLRGLLEGTAIGLRRRW